MRNKFIYKKILDSSLVTEHKVFYLVQNYEGNEKHKTLSQTKETKGTAMQFVILKGILITEKR